MKTHISILAHLEGKEAFERHWPYWIQQVEDRKDILVWFPEDSKFNVDGISTFAVGKKQHHGAQAIIRFRYMLSHLCGLTSYDRFIIQEYDSISLEVAKFSKADICANAFVEANTGGQFLSPIFTHPPLIFSAAGLRKIVEESKAMPEMEGGFWDRWLGLAIHRSGATLENFLATGAGFSHNTILPSHHQAAYTAVMKGAVHLHGVKDKETLLTIQRAHERKRALLLAETIRAEEGL